MMCCCRTAPTWESGGTADKRSLATEKAESNVGDHCRDFLRNFKALVRGARTLVGTRLKGREKASATMFLEPGMWTISLVNSEM